MRLLAILICLAAVLVGPPATRAHEVRPAIADLTLASDGATLEIFLNLEAIVAEINLDGLEDTNASEGSGEYDRLRALPPDALASAFQKYWPRMRENIVLESANGPVQPELAEVEVDAIGNVELPRQSRLLLTAGPDLPVQVGWAPEYGDLILRQMGLPVEQAFTGLLRGGERSPPIGLDGAESEGAMATFIRYIGVGFDHILPKGLDHILFVLGLYFLAPKLSTLLWQVSAFTLAHTVTLALGALGIVSVSPAIVEPLIAASIVYVAVENIFTEGLNPWRPLLIFCFGLLHGLGFASVLGEFGLPEAQFVPALIGFNVGVEFGQLAVIALAFLAVGAWFRSKHWYRRAIAIPASACIALVGAWWVVERTLL